MKSMKFLDGKKFGARAGNQEMSVMMMNLSQIGAGDNIGIGSIGDLAAVALIG